MTGDAAHWDARYRATPLVWSSEPNRFVTELTASLTPGWALDLATGEGRNAVWLASQGWRVTGVDFSAGGLAKAAARAGPLNLDVDWVQADLLRYRPDRTYDLVLLCYLQLPDDDRRAVHRMAASMLNPGGTLLIVAHHTTNLTEGWGGPQDPAFLFTEDDVMRDLTGLASVRIVSASRRERPVETPDGERVALDTVVAIRKA